MMNYHYYTKVLYDGTRQYDEVAAFLDQHLNDLFDLAKSNRSGV